MPDSSLSSLLPNCKHASAGKAFQCMLRTDPETGKRLQAFAVALRAVLNNPEHKAALKQLKASQRRLWQKLAAAIRAGNQRVGDELVIRHFSRPRSLEDWIRIARIAGIPTDRVGGLALNEIYEVALVWSDRQRIIAKLAVEAEAASQERGLQGRGNADETRNTGAAGPAVVTNRGQKRSTARGEARAKLIAALTMHHRYADDGCLNQEPIGNNELARMANVSNSTASEFFDKEFGGHERYKAMCRDVGRLLMSLRLLNGEYSPCHLYGGNPPERSNRDDDGDDSD